MNATDTFEQLSEDLSKSLAALLNVKTIEEQNAEGLLSGFKYNQEKHMLEYWISLGKYSVSMDLIHLAFVINGKEQIVPTNINSRDDINNYILTFLKNKEKVISAFNAVINKPNQIFIGYSQPITMEEFLQKVVSDIHNESINLDSCYHKLQQLN